VTSGTGITIGQAVYGTSISTGTIVAGISGTTVTLSLVPSAALVSGAALQFGMTMAQAFVGVDGTAGIRSGMYALRGSGATHATLCDLYDSFTFTSGASPALTGGTIDTWAAQAAFGFSERIYMVGAAAPGDMPGNWAGYNAPGIVGAQNWSFKAMFGDWCYWSDVTNNMVRMVSPATFAMARLAAQSPVLSALNQPIFGISGSQFANSNLVWTQADIAIVQAAGFDVIVPPGQGAGGQNIWSCATGNNAAPNGAVQGDNYTTMTNYVVSSLAQAGAIGPYIGDAITASLNQVIYGELANFGQSLEDAGLIGNAQGTPAFTVTNTSTPTQNQNGIDVFAMQIQYLSILRQFAINVQGGQTVTIQDQATGQYLF
jgi:hypothetical protein